MLKKILFSVVILLLLSNVFAGEICPDSTDLNNNVLHGWQAFNINTGMPISAEELAQLTAVSKIQSFSLAEWMQDAPEGEAHCYYDQPNFSIYFAKQGLIADKNFASWHPVGYDDMQCNISINACIFHERTE